MNGLLFLSLHRPEIRQGAPDLNKERNQDRKGRSSFPKRYRRSLGPAVKSAQRLLRADWNGGRRENRWDNRHGIGWTDGDGTQAPERRKTNKSEEAIPVFYSSDLGDPVEAVDIFGLTLSNT
jgi:hypothetical protein